MSAAKVELQNMAAFIHGLRSLPAELAREAAAIVEAHATEHAAQTKAGYPVGPTGNLKRGVTLQIEQNKVFSAGIVRTRAKHAWLYDNGSKKRKTRTGANRGSMPSRPPAERFIPRAIRTRARMTRQLIALVERAGFVVTQS